MGERPTRQGVVSVGALIPISVKYVDGEVLNIQINLFKNKNTCTQECENARIGNNFSTEEALNAFCKLLPH